MTDGRLVWCTIHNEERPTSRCFEEGCADPRFMEICLAVHDWERSMRDGELVAMRCRGCGQTPYQVLMKHRLEG